MAKENISKTNFDLWNLIGKVRHQIFLARQKELSEHNIAVRQAYVLRTINDLGPKATIYEVARIIERKVPVVSRQTADLERDGLIVRIKDKPKSNLFRLELTSKGLEMVKISDSSKLLDTIFVFLTKADRKKMESILNQILVNLDEYPS
jgi:DNA-binding MarR family transcriptional regulator